VTPGAYGWTLRLPFQRPPMSMNDLRRQGRWQVQQRAHDEVRDAVLVLCKQCKARRFDVPVAVELVWHAKGKRRRDPDSLGAMAKGALDGLTAAGVLADDAAPHVQAVTSRVLLEADDPHIELTVREALA
jgi:Holliday junction resolvase RusA-like endonuclease